MAITRRQLGKLALAGVPAAALVSRYGSLMDVLAQGRIAWAILAKGGTYRAPALAAAA